MRQYYFQRHGRDDFDRSHRRHPAGTLPHGRATASNPSIHGQVRGTPRTYGKRSTEDIWRQAIVSGEWPDLSGIPLDGPVSLEFSFRVDPACRDYNNVVSKNGPDLDTMVVGALDGLVESRSGRPTVGILRNRQQVVMIRAQKELVSQTGQAGVDISILPCDGSAFERLRSWQYPPALTFDVSKLDLKEASRKEGVKNAASTANGANFRAPRSSRIGIFLAFNESTTSSPFTAGWLEAVIDGLGASVVGDNRFFDVPIKPKSEFGNDDSVVFWLACAKVKDLPAEIGIRFGVYNQPALVPESQDG